MNTERSSRPQPSPHRLLHIPDKVCMEEAAELRPVQSVRRAKLLRLAAQGVNAKRAAAFLGVSHQTVLKEYQNPEFRRQVVRLVESAFEEVDEKFEVMQLSLHDRIRLKSEEAFETLCRLMDDENTHPAVRTRIAQDMLDRNPETLAGSVVRHDSVAEAEELRRAADVAREMDKVVEIRKVG